jgi:hypothetical protein
MMFSLLREEAEGTTIAATGNCNSRVFSVVVAPDSFERSEPSRAKSEGDTRSPRSGVEQSTGSGSSGVFAPPVELDSFGRTGGCSSSLQLEGEKACVGTSGLEWKAGRKACLRLASLISLIDTGAADFVAGEKNAPRSRCSERVPGKPSDIEKEAAGLIIEVSDGRSGVGVGLLLLGRGGEMNREKGNTEEIVTGLNWEAEPVAVSALRQVSE